MAGKKDCEIRVQQPPDRIVGVAASWQGRDVLLATAKGLVDMMTILWQPAGDGGGDGRGKRRRRTCSLKDKAERPGCRVVPSGAGGGDFWCGWGQAAYQPEPA